MLHGVIALDTNHKVQSSKLKVQREQSSKFKGNKVQSIKMGNPKAFLTIPRKEAGYRPIHDRILDFSEVEQTLNSNDRRQQASRCMDCGVPFCHWACPLGNKAPEWNDALYKGDWE